MKRFFLFLISVFLFILAPAQNSIRVPEPEWIGETVIVTDSISFIPTEKVIAEVKIKELFMGPAKKLYVKGRSSTVRVQKEMLHLIIRVENNNIDPISVIRIFKFSGKKNRDAVISKQNELTGTISYNQYEQIPFIGKRYGESSYLLKIENLQRGEYGITVGNPNENKTLVISAFGVD